MAGKSPAQLDKEAIEKFNRNLKENVEREARLTRQYYWRGNKLPPFAIEPFPYERQRLANGGMTPEERALRKQWVMDQQLAPNEPIHVKELYPKNAIRRLLAAPWDILFATLRPLVVLTSPGFLGICVTSYIYRQGKKLATVGRFYIPRLTMSLAAVWLMWYQMKYNPNQWTGHQGFHMYRTKPIVLPGDSAWPNPMEKEHDEFHERGFKSRKAFRDVSKTSMVD